MPKLIFKIWKIKSRIGYFRINNYKSNNEINSE